MHKIKDGCEQPKLSLFIHHVKDKKKVTLQKTHNGVLDKPFMKLIFSAFQLRYRFNIKQTGLASKKLHTVR